MSAVEKTECCDRKMNDQGKPLFEEVSWKLKPKEQEPAILQRMGRCPMLRGRLQRARRKERYDTLETESHQEEPLNIWVSLFLVAHKSLFNSYSIML